MPRVYFWNAEHLSNNADLLAAARRERLLRMNLRIHRQLSNRGRNQGLTRPVTRGAKKYAFKARGPAKFGSLIQKPSGNRAQTLREVREVRMMLDLDRAERNATIKRRKLETQNWLEQTGHPVCYCEVQQNFIGRTSSLRAAVAPGPATLCYWTNLPGGIADPAGTPAAGAGVAGPPGGPHLVHGNMRIPKHGVMAGTNLFFWHAPSGNNGQVVAAVWAWIKAQYAGTNCILFGDLNADPGQVGGQGVPVNEIATPGGPTRLSGRVLDYALANFAGVSVVRAFDQAAPPTQIKTRFGSDHAAMRLDW